MEGLGSAKGVCYIRRPREVWGLIILPKTFQIPHVLFFLDRTATNVPQVRMVKTGCAIAPCWSLFKACLSLWFYLDSSHFMISQISGCFSRQGINSISITPIFPLLHVMKGCYHLILLLKDCCNTKSYCPTEISISYPWLIGIHFRSSN